jgi:hypothetical protein
MISRCANGEITFTYAAEPQPNLGVPLAKPQRPQRKQNYTKLGVLGAFARGISESEGCRKFTQAAENFN